MKRIWRKIRNYIKTLLAADTGRRGADDSSTPAASGTVPDGGTGSTAATADGVDFSLLRWRYGWDASLLSKADAFAFVIEDDRARHRTNVIVQEGRI